MTLGSHFSGQGQRWEDCQKSLLRAGGFQTELKKKVVGQVKQHDVAHHQDWAEKSTQKYSKLIRMYFITYNTTIIRKGTLEKQNVVHL